MEASWLKGRDEEEYQLDCNIAIGSLYSNWHSGLFCSHLLQIQVQTSGSSLSNNFSVPVTSEKK
jgi:hypothetical protein